MRSVFVIYFFIFFLSQDLWSKLSIIGFNSVHSVMSFNKFKQRVYIIKSIKYNLNHKIQEMHFIRREMIYIYLNCAVSSTYQLT
jgi:hypothetical protein